MELSVLSSENGDLDQKIAFYRKAFEMLNASKIPFLVGGAYALQRYTGVVRDTKDIDIFMYRQDLPRALEMLTAGGYRTEFTYQHWLGKVLCDDYVIDLIFSSGNGISEVDEVWFKYSREGEFFGVPLRICPPEEMIWSKAFVMERERYDGADIMHLLLACARDMDWQRLLDRFGSHWRILYSNLILFGFVYPTERNLIPDWVMRELHYRLEREMRAPPSQDRVCQGTLLSHTQYGIDVEARGFVDARLLPRGNMTEEEVATWVSAFAEK